MSETIDRPTEEMGLEPARNVGMIFAALAAAAMAGLEALSHQRGFAWLDSFSMAGSMLVGMGGAVVLGLL